MDWMDFAIRIVSSGFFGALASYLVSRNQIQLERERIEEEYNTQNKLLEKNFELEREKLEVQRETLQNRINEIEAQTKSVNDQALNSAMLEQLLPLMAEAIDPKMIKDLIAEEIKKNSK